ncbi:MAG TPA: tetratricopeptide repeat protein [Methylophilaceae bacterium]|nr:tetratricopeptide repeat protein [Methylophilaceae bacterium]
MNFAQHYRKALDLHRDGRFTEAEATYRELLSQNPRHADTLHLLGILHHQTSRHEEAAHLIARAIALEPDNADYLNNHGLALRAAGQLQAALASYLKAMQLAPHDTDIQTNLGNVYQELGRFEEAAGCFRRVLYGNAKDMDVWNALCHALQSLAEQYHLAGQYHQAEAAYLELLELAGDKPHLHYNLGNAQRELGKPAEAAKSYQQALKHAPEDADIYNNLGNVLRELGRLDEAIACYEKALQLEPQLYHAKVHLVHQKQHVCDWQGLERDIAEIREWVRTVPEAQVSPFAFLSMPGTTPEEQKLCAEHWVENRYGPLIAQGGKQLSLHARNAKEKLRIGYLSADFRLHPLAFLISELIELHDRNRFETFAYSYGHNDNTPERRRLEQAFDHFIDVGRMSLPDTAQTIHQDGIDILVDLTGFTQSTRSGLLALRPTPIQVNWLGFPGSMGRTFFDYILSDGFITPHDQALHYGEQLALLPCYQPNDRKRPIATIPTRAAAGLPEQGFVFCCFNQTFKITPQLFDVWMRLLQGVPESVLWLLECNRWAKDNLHKEASLRGIDPARLIFAPRVPIAEHLARHALADVFLDTLPYNAHTTTSDALWVGVPVITCPGETFTSRVAGSLLRAAGMQELITNTLADYEQLALKLATEPAQLQALKDKLRTSKNSMPLFDMPKFTQNLEQAYLHMWQRWQNGQPATSFSIE